MISLMLKKQNSNAQIQICQSYLKFDAVYNKENIDKFLEVTNSFINEIIPSSFKESFEIKHSIIIENGSLKVKITFWGVINKITKAIIIYGSMRSAIDHIIIDSKNISSKVHEEFSKNSQTKDCILRYEKRTGFPGRINEIFESIDILERNLCKMSQNEIDAQLINIRQKVSNISSLLDYNTEAELLKELPKLYTHNLPPVEKKKEKFYYDKYFQKPTNNYSKDKK